MKRLFKIGIVLLSLAMMFTSCKEDETPKTEIVNITVKMPEELSNGKFNGEIKMTNIDMDKEYTETAVDGTVSFDVYPGIYNIEAQLEMTAEDAKAIAPDMLFGNDVIIAGIQKEVAVNILPDAEPMEITLNTEWSFKSDLVISKVYCDGTMNNNETSNMMPKYWEVFNNTDEVIYLDGLCIAQVHGNTTSNNPCDLYIKDKNNTYASRIARFPGNHGVDQNIPLEPGKSVVIAWHASNFIVPENTSETSSDKCTMNVDLTNADYEIESTSRMWMNLGDNVNVPNLKAIYDCNPFSGFLLVSNAIIIFYATEEEIDSWPADVDKSSYVAPFQQSQLAKQVPNDRILDAVEVFKAGASQQKRIPDVLEASGIQGIWNEGVIYDRRIKEIKEDGRIVLVDTNNSADDFVIVKSRNRKEYDGSHLIIRDYTKPEIQPVK